MKWTSFKHSKPTFGCMPEYSIDRTDMRIEVCSQFIFDIEITEGKSNGLRTVIPVYFAHGDINDWCISYMCETVKDVFGNVKYLYWMPFPLPVINPSQP